MATTGSLTKLEAVNRMLRGAKERPVSSIDSPTINDSLVAIQILDEKTKQIQMGGLHCNTTQTSFTPDGTTSRVILPANTMQVQGFAQHEHRNFFHRCVDGEVRLFDGSPDPLAAATDAFEDDDEVHVRITQLLAFEDLPVQIQFWIVDEAAVEYQMDVLGSSTADQRLSQRALISRAAGRAYDNRMRPGNMFINGRSQGLRAGRQYVPRTWPYNDRPQL